MIKDEDVKIGEHCWATSDGDLMVVLKAEDGGFQVCGAWGCGIGIDNIELIGIINRPEGYEDTRLYYG